MPEESTPALLVELTVAARNGDWDRLALLSSLLPAQPPPQTERAMTDYLFELQTSIIAARTARADIVKSLHRLAAASGFNKCG